MNLTDKVLSHAITGHLEGRNPSNPLIRRGYGEVLEDFYLKDYLE